MTRDISTEYAVLGRLLADNPDDLELRRRRDTARAAMTSAKTRELYLETYPAPKPPRKKHIMTTPKIRPSDEEFVRAYQTSKTTNEAAEKLGCPDCTRWVGLKAAALRRIGVQLHTIRPNAVRTDRVDVDALNKLIAEVGE